MPLNKTEALRHAQQFALQGNVISAINVYEKIVAADPADLAALSALGDLYVKANRTPEAIEKFSHIAESCMERGSAVHAAYYLKKALEIEPANASMRMRLGEIYSHEGLADKAHEAFVQAGVAYRQSGDLAKAMAANQQALTVKANSRPATEAIGVLQREMADQQALPDQAVDQVPHDLLMEFDALNAMRTSRLPNDASPASKPAALGEEQVVERISTAELLVAYGQVDEAVEMLKNVLESKPGNVDVHIKLKDIYLRSEMIEAAAEECMEISRIYATHGDTERARDYVIRAQRLIPAHEAKGAKPTANLAERRDSAELAAAPLAGEAPADIADPTAHEALSDQFATSPIDVVLPVVSVQSAVEEELAPLDFTFALPSVDEQAVSQPMQLPVEQAVSQPAEPVVEAVASPLAQPGVEEAIATLPAEPVVEEVAEEMAPAQSVPPPVEETVATQTVKASTPMPVATPQDRPTVKEAKAAPPAPVAEQVAADVMPLQEAAPPVKRNKKRTPVAEPEKPAVAADDSSMAATSEAAPLVMNNTVSEAVATSSTAALPATAQEKPRPMVAVAAAGGKSKKGLYAVALMVGLLAVAVSVAIPLYKSRNSQKPEAVAQQAEPPAAAPDTPSPAPQDAQQAALTPPIAEQVEVRASDPPSEGVDKPARIEKERPEKAVAEVPYVEPPAKSAPDAAKISVPLNANKPTTLAPPRVGSAPNAQGGAEPRSETASMPRSAGGMPEPPPPTPAAATAPKSSVVTPSQTRLTVQPDYPQLAKTTRQAGVVVVEVSINDRGDVTSARALSGPSLLRDAAISAARKWKFKPALRDGKPVGSTTTLGFNFKM